SCVWSSTKSGSSEAWEQGFNLGGRRRWHLKFSTDVIRALCVRVSENVTWALRRFDSLVLLIEEVFHGALRPPSSARPSTCWCDPRAADLTHVQGHYRL